MKKSKRTKGTAEKIELNDGPTQHLHKSVMWDETLEWWSNENITGKSGLFVDCTFGRGGHSRALINLKTNAELLVFDKDPEAIEVATKLAEETVASGQKMNVFHSSYADIAGVLEKNGYSQKVDGILMDLGVSSPQLDEAERGFSFMRNGPLDMRMNSSAGMTAAEWLAKVDEKTLADVIYQLGEEKQSRRIAKKIVMARAEKPIETTAELADLVCQVVPRRVVGKHPATRTFQAIRMHINNELGDLQQGLKGAFEMLAPGGKLVVLSFHSLEDRIVKRFMQQHSKPADLPRGLPVLAADIAPPGKVCVKGSKPRDEEINVNPRARSAILRVIEKVNTAET